MKIEKNDINLYDTLMSGQAFRITLESDKSFTCILSDRVVNIKEDGNYLIVDSNKMDDLEMVIKYYLDYGRDYKVLNDELKKNELFKDKISLCNGYKVLKQDKFEMLISYIISQNNNVKRISGAISKISERYGEKVLFGGKEYYLFPMMSEFIKLSLDDLKEFNLGFRDKYVYDAICVLKENPFYLEEVDMLDTEDAIKKLMEIKGIGLKVASCILMFGYARFDTFPIDTWVKKYVKSNLNIDNVKNIKDYMKNNFGLNSGLAIQYLYHINRNLK